MMLTFALIIWLNISKIHPMITDERSAIYFTSFVRLPADEFCLQLRRGSRCITHPMLLPFSARCSNEKFWQNGVGSRCEKKERINEWYACIAYDWTKSTDEFYCCCLLRVFHSNFNVCVPLLSLVRLLTFPIWIPSEIVHRHVLYFRNAEIAWEKFYIFFVLSRFSI